MLRIILTGERYDSGIVPQWESWGAAIECIDMDQVILTIRRERELQADCFVCIVDEDIEMVSRGLGTSLESALSLSEDIELQPDSLAMLDGRKWNALPFVVLIRGDGWPGVGSAIGPRNLCVAPYAGPRPSFEIVKIAVADYRQRLLDELDNLGLLVTYEEGRYKVGHVLGERPGLEGRYYHAASDQRSVSPGELFTVDRDIYGTQQEVSRFETLINAPDTTEGDLQKFFESHPHFLPMQGLMHAFPQVQLRDAQGNLLIPDFVLKPLVASQRDSNWQVLDLKRPQAKLLAGPSNHRRFSQDVSSALAQLRDYGDYFQNPSNTAEVERVLGHSVRHPMLAVVIGRLPSVEQVPDLELEQSRNPNVRIVTYDELLERQQMGL